MSALWRASCLAVLATVPVYASTIIGGDIHELTFGPEGNPYVVEQDAFVPEGTTVVVQAGSVFMFKPFTGLKVDGELTVEGTAEAPVVFTSIHDTAHGPATGQLPNAFDWNGIQVTASCPAARFSHIHLKYSVHGIMSSTAHVTVDNGVFAQNGQFHLKVNEKLHYVQDNVPYTYSSGSAAGPAPSPGTVDAGRGRDEWAMRPQRTKAEKRKLVVRYICLGAAVVGLGTGTYFAIRSADYGDQQDASAGAVEWDDLEESRLTTSNAAIASFIVGGTFLAGFTVTLFF